MHIKTWVKTGFIVMLMGRGIIFNIFPNSAGRKIKENMREKNDF